MEHGNDHWFKYGFTHEYQNPVDCHIIYTDQWKIGCYYKNDIKIMLYVEGEGLYARGEYKIPETNRIYDKLTLSKGFTQSSFARKEVVYALLSNSKNDYSVLLAAKRDDKLFDSRYTTEEKIAAFRTDNKPIKEVASTLK